MGLFGVEIAEIYKKQKKLALSFKNESAFVLVISRIVDHYVYKCWLF